MGQRGPLILSVGIYARLCSRLLECMGILLDAIFDYGLYFAIILHCCNGYFHNAERAYG